MAFSYRPQGVCSRRIDFEIEDHKIKNVRFLGGCLGNLKAISVLIEGMDIDKVKSRLKGIRCGFKSTSCSDQLTRAIEAAEAQGAE